MSIKARSVVLIESDWNLKLYISKFRLFQVQQVLIESDWNLKLFARIPRAAAVCCINRIRLEFKGLLSFPALCCGSSINRIRLEFKGAWVWIPCEDAMVLIESDWNLKT